MITKDPIVISFFTDDPYYESQAEFFADDCRRLGLKLYVEEFEAREWASSCAQKANFILKCLRQTQSPVVWIDIDTRIIRNPVDFLPPNVDFAAFTRSFSHLSKFPLLAKRFWTPGYLYFNYTREALAFAEAMVEFGTAQNKLHTDDYLLHKAWIERGRDLTVFPIPPKYATYYKGRILGSDSRLLFQASGNAPQNKNKVVQHVLWTSSEEVDGDLQAVTTQHELIQKLIRPKEKRKKKKKCFRSLEKCKSGRSKTPTPRKIICHKG